MLGIDDPLVLLAFLGCLAVAALSLVYGLVRRNAAVDEVTPEDRASALVLASLLALPAAAEQTFGAATLGADLRLREVCIGNIGFNDQAATANRSFQRYRIRGWGKYDFGEHFSAAARLIWEGRHYNLPPASAWPVPGFETWYDGGILFDGLTLDLKRIGDSPLSVKAGRQDIRLGEGWLAVDGTPSTAPGPSTWTRRGRPTRRSPSRPPWI